MSRSPAARRTRILEALGDGVLLLAAAPVRSRSADIEYPYRQDSDFAYVTGFPEPEAVAVLNPRGPDRFILFVRSEDPERAIWVGPRVGVDGARTAFGADAAYPIDALEQELPKVLAGASHIVIDLEREDPLQSRLMGIVRKVRADRPRAGSGPTTLRDAGEVLHELRLRKEPTEIETMRAAITIACEAHALAVRAARPGMFEYELEALIDYTFRSRGATGWAYPSIVASGPNATILHYIDNDRRLGPDELLLIDAGCELDGYCADVTRTFPTGRRFAPAHRNLYDAVLAAQLAAIAAIRPGATVEGIHAVAVRVLAEALLGLGLLAGTVDEIVGRELYKRFFMHRTSHWLGRDVHDVGVYRVRGGSRPLEPGMIITVEPGLYVPRDADDLPEAYRGAGIRIEDDVLVTDAGHEVLSAAAPKQVAELEALRAEGLDRPVASGPRLGA